MNLQDFRKQYPQYDDLGDKQLVDGLHKKHYSDIPLTDFQQKIGYAKSVPPTDPNLRPPQNMQSATGTFEQPVAPPTPSPTRQQPLTSPTQVKRASWTDTMSAPLKSWPDIASSMVGGILYRHGADASNVPTHIKDGKIQYDVKPLPEYAKVGSLMYSNAQKAIADKKPENMSFMKGLTYDTGMMLLKMAPVAVAGVASRGNVMATLTPMYAQVRGERYSALRDKGFKHEKAALHADMAAVIEVGTEVIPIGWMMKRGTPFLKRIIQGTVGEGLQESVSSALQSAWDKGTIQPDMTFNEALRAAGYEGLIGTIGGGTMATAAHPFFKDIQQTAETTPNYPQWKMRWQQGEPDVGKLWPEMVEMGKQEWLQPQIDKSVMPTQEKLPTPNLQDMQKDPQYWAEKKGKAFHIENMTPDAYLDATAKGFKKSPDELAQDVEPKLVDEYAKAMERGEKFPVLQLDYSDGFSQEGRHRAFAAQQAGFETVPVAVIEKVEADRRQRKGGREDGRRQDITERKRVEHMTQDEMRTELRTSRKTGIPNDRAYEEATKLPVQASVDADSLKWINDNMSHGTGDVMLKEIAQALYGETEQAYHLSGDEFAVQANTREELLTVMSAVQERLKNAKLEVTLPDGTVVTKTGLDLTYGVGEDFKSADFELFRQKAKREAEGTRAGRYQEPQGVVRFPPQRQQDNLDQDTAEEVEIPTRTTRGGPAGGMGPVSATDVLGAEPQTKVAGTDLEPFLDKLNSSQDAQDVFKRTVKMFEGQFDMARRGKIPWKQTEAMARSYGFDHILKRKVGEAWNPEQYEAARLFLDTAMEEVTADAKKANESGSTEDLARFQNHLDKFVLAGQQMLGARAEWGRVGGIMRKQAMTSAQLEKVLDSMGDRETIASKAKVLSDLQDMGLESKELSKRATQLQSATTMEKLLEIWKAGLLTGLPTQAVNLSSNAVNAVLNIPETLISGLMGKVHGGDKVYLRETIARTYGLIHGTINGARYGWEAFKTGQPVFDTETKVHEITPRQQGAVGTDPGSSVFAQIAGKAVRTPFRFLTAGDEFFKAVARETELGAQAMRQAIKEGKGSERAKEIENRVTDLYGKDKPDFFISKDEKAMWNLRDEVIDFSKYMTYQTELGPAGKKFTGMLREASVLQFVVPFVRTPVNIVKYGVGHTAAGVLMPSVVNQLKQGGAARDVAIGRMITGTGLMATVMYFAAQGIITGSGPTDPAERRVWLQQYQPNSIKIDGKWYAFGRIEPLGMMFGISADIYTASKALNQDDVEGQEQVLDAASIVYTSLVKNLASKTFLKGITDAVAAYYDPDRYGKWYLGNMLGTTVPTIVAHAAAADDPYRRRAEDLLEKIQKRIPIQRKKLLPVRDMFGEPLPNGETWGPRMVSPIYTKWDKDDPVVKELLALEVYPSKPQRTVAGVRLTPKRYDRYLELSGQIARKTLEMIIASPAYKNIAPFMQQEMLADAFLDARKVARLLMLKENQQLIVEQVSKKLEGLKRERK